MRELTPEIVRSVFAGVIATLVIVIGFAFLYQAMKLEADKRDALIIGAVIALVTAATQYVFGQDIANRAARQTERATKAAADATASLVTPPSPPPPPEGQ